jgi:predicted nucleotide-binding protein (sugar kinase/HSP70/actin superfamily)
LGRAALDGARRAIVVIGKPYNVLDPYVNMNLLEQLRRLGELALPMWCLPFEREELDPGPATLPWSMNRDIMRAVRFCLRDERLFPVVVSSFGCGPDAFMRPHLERLLDGRRALVLEFDEHRAEAGLVTRLEAFLDEIDAPRARAVPPGTGEVSPRVEAAPEPRSPVRYVLPHFADHVYAYSGALKAAGHRVRVLDLPDERTLELGEARSSGKECHPFSILTGDLVRVALAERDGPEVFLYPGTMIPCLLHQYGEAHRMILEQMGVGGLSVQTPGFAGIKDMLGLELGARMWRGLVAVDLLIKMACETRPYELSPGATDEAHRRNLRDLERAIVADELSTTLAAITRRMRDIPVDRSCRRPVVGVAGDIYTRINPAGNQDLFAWLEERGCEVWPAPFLVDITDFSLRHGWRRAGLGDAAVLGALMVRKGVESWRVRRLLRGAVRRLDEPGYRQVLAMASPYLGENQNEVLVLNVAKMVHFARNGADGILNAACFNCMLGAVSSAITTRISADHGRIPITTLVYSSVRDSQRAALDAFVHQLTGPPTRHAEEPSVPLNPQR